MLNYTVSGIIDEITFCATYLDSAGATFDVVNVGRLDFGVFQDFFEQFDLLLVGGINGSFGPETLVVGARVHRGRVHSPRVFGALHVHDDNGVAAYGPGAWKR